MEYGWHNDTYIFNNSCFYFNKEHCKPINKTSDTQAAKKNLSIIYKIFFNEEYGKYTLLIFNYCLASLFTSKLKLDNLHVPFFLQIACERDSVLYHLIQKIASICDVNSGIFKECNERYHDYGYCEYTQNKTYYPTQYLTNDIETLIHNRDIPIIIEGYENERYYATLLREIANIPSKRSSLLDLKDKLNVIPLFICSDIKSSFNNVFSIDFTEVNINEKYLTFLQDNKQLIYSWVLELVNKFNNHLFPYMGGSDKKRNHPFSHEIGNYINHIQTKYTDISFKNAENVSFLNFFFKGFLRVFQKTFTFPIEEEFEWIKFDDKPIKHNGEKAIIMLYEQSEKSLTELHKLYLPKPISNGIKNKEAIKLSKKIEKYYRDLKVNILITPVNVNEGMYKFYAKTIYRTKDIEISKNASTIQRRLNFEYFKVDLTTPAKIEIFASENPSKENSLIKILKHPNFINSKMKIPFAIGYDEMGSMCIEDLCEFPNLLIGGATLSGKSVALTCLLMSIIYKHRTGDVKVVVIDLEGRADSKLEVFNNDPILLCPVIRDVETAFLIIMKLNEIMKKRENEDMSDMPYIVCIIDEFPKLFLDLENKVASKELANALNRLLSGCRHQNIHLVLAAQDPKSKHMVCDTSNVPARIAFKCVSHHRSASILGRTGAGAEKLFGKGRMIFDSYNGIDKRLQGAYISKADVKKLLNEIRSGEFYNTKNKYHFDFNLTPISMESNESETIIFPKSSGDIKKEKFNKNLLRIIEILLDKGKISNSAIMQILKVSFKTANKYIEKLEYFGFISDLNNGRRPRKIKIADEIKIAELKEFMEKCGYSEEDIIDALKKIPRYIMPISPEEKY